MSADLPKQESPCAVGCSRCRAGQDGPAAPGALAGWRLVLAAVVVFLLPLATAAGGAILVGPVAGWQLAGAMAGLAVGVILAMGLAWLIRRPAKEMV